MLLPVNALPVNTLPVYHLIVISINSLAIWYDQKYVKLPLNPKIEELNLPFNNRILFLTKWGIALQTIYFIVALLNDIFGTNARSPKKTPIIRRFKDVLFSLALPIGLYVFLTFWVIYFYDKELIFPQALAKIIPVWVNHVMHTTIAPFVLLELLLSSVDYPSRKTGLSLTVGFILCYTGFSLYIYQLTGTFVYPILNVLNWPLRIVFFAMTILLSMGMYVLGESIDSAVNHPKQAHKTKRH